MSSTIVRALIKISDPRDPEFELTGEKDKWGTRLRKKVMKYVEPHVLFDISIFDEPTQKQLWEMEAVEAASGLTLR